MWLVVNPTPRPLYPRERDTVPIMQEAGWASGTVWAGARNVALHGYSIPGPFSPVANRYIDYAVPENDKHASRKTVFIRKTSRQVKTGRKLRLSLYMWEEFSA